MLFLLANSANLVYYQIDHLFLFVTEHADKNATTSKLPKLPQHGASEAPEELLSSVHTGSGNCSMVEQTYSQSSRVPQNVSVQGPTASPEVKDPVPISQEAETVTRSEDSSSSKTQIQGLNTLDTPSSNRIGSLESQLNGGGIGRFLIRDSKICD